MISISMVLWKRILITWEMCKKSNKKKSSRSSFLGLKTGMFQLNEVFVYPLLCTIQDHCYLKIYNLEVSSGVYIFNSSGGF